MKSLRYLIIFLVTLSLGWAVFAQDNAETDTVRVVYSSFISFSWIDIGIEEGYFADQNIEIEKVVFTNPADGLLPLLQGDVDVMGSILNPALLNAMTRTEDVRIVGSMNYYESNDTCNSIRYFIAADRADELQSPADLAGATVITASGSPDYLLELLLNAGDLSYDDITPNYLIPPARPDAVVSGAADMMFANEPWATRADQDERLVEFAPMLEFAELTQFGVISYGDTMLSNDDLATRFATAALQSIRQYNEGATERNQEIISEATGLTPEVLQSICWQFIQSDGLIDLDSTQAYADFAFAQEFIDEEMNMTEFYTPDFMEEANTILGPAMPEMEATAEVTEEANDDN